MSYANVAATLALVVALGSGTAVAVENLGKDSVRSKQVKNNSLRSADLKNGKGVKGADVVADSIGGAQVDESSLAKVASAEAADNAGLLDGLDSTEFISAVRVRVATTPNVTAGSTVSEDAMCEEGERVLGGGGTFDPSSSDDRVVLSAPVAQGFISSESQEARGWRFRAHRSSGSANFHVYVICGR